MIESRARWRGQRSDLALLSLFSHHLRRARDCATERLHGSSSCHTSREPCETCAGLTRLVVVLISVRPGRHGRSSSSARSDQLDVRLEQTWTQLGDDGGPRPQLSRPSTSSLSSGPTRPTMALDLDRAATLHRLVDEETILDFGRKQLGFVQMLLVLVPASSIIFVRPLSLLSPLCAPAWARLTLPLCSQGMALRLAVTYASRYFRDRWVYRVIVPVLSLLATGSIAAQVALVFQTVTVIVDRSGTHLDRSPITVLAQVCATAMSIIARGFFIARMYEVRPSCPLARTAADVLTRTVPRSSTRT